MRIARRAVALTIVGGSALVAACGSSDSPAAQPGSGGSSGAAGGSGSLPCEATEALDMTGTWAAFARFSVSMQGQSGGVVAVCPDDQVRQSSLLLLLDMTQAQGSTSVDPIQAVACWMELPTVTAIAGQCAADAPNLVTTQILAPPAMIDAMAGVQIPPGKGTLSGLQPGARWTPDRLAFTLGARPDADLPVWNVDASTCGMKDVSAGRTQSCETACVSDCSALMDADGDGWPGVTAHVCGTTADDVAAKVECNPETPNAGGVTLQGRALLDLRIDPLFDGTVKSSCEVSGQVDARVVYNVIGADIYLANTQISVASAIKSLPGFQVDSANSLFRMIRVDGRHGAPDWGVDMTSAAAACAVAAQHRNELL